jgi:hypothetical protein
MGRNKGKTGVLFGPPRAYQRLCIACRRPILYGDAPAASVSYAYAASAGHDEQAHASMPGLWIHSPRRASVLVMYTRPRPGAWHPPAARLHR